MAIELDIGPLTWVKGEIDQALERARESLAGFSGNPQDASPLRFCQTHLHQVTGAIQMVGLEGAARVSDEIEKGVAALEKQQVAPSAENIDIINQAISALSKYLADLLDGEPDVPLKLFPIYKNLHQVRGAEDFSESDLFFPDLSERAPKDPAASPVAEAELPVLAKAERARYQWGLLKFLRDNSDLEGMEAMRNALLAIERVQAKPAQRTFWWAAGALIESLINHGGLNSEPEAKRLLGKLDQQIRKLADSSSKVAERLLRDILYQVACSEPLGERVKQVKRVFDLDSCLPQVASSGGSGEEAAKVQPLLRELKALQEPLKDAWLKFATGRKESLKTLRESARMLAEKSRALKIPPLQELIEQIQAVASAQSEQGGVEETVAMEMATALLLVESVLENFAQYGDELARQLQIQTRRMQAVLGGRLEELGAPESFHLSDISRKAQEKMLLAQVAQEIQVNLRRIEEVLDAFFRDAAKREELPALGPVLKQISGALKILELEQADKLLELCEARIRNFEDSSHELDPLQLDAVAEGLSGLGFYIEALREGRPDPEKIIGQTLARLTGEPEETQVVPPEEAAEVFTEEPFALGLEEQESFGEWQAHPAGSSTRPGQKLDPALTGLAQDTDLAAYAELEEQTFGVQRLPDNLQETPALGQAAVAETKVPTRPPSKEVARLLDASEEAVDAELLETYLEEATEVLATVSENLQVCQDQPANRDALTTLRRGFHTLKGSGRMVGLNDLGEVAWAVEQVLNKWLQEEKSATPTLLNLIAQAHASFEYWVGRLQAEGSVVVEADALLALAEQLKSGEDVAEAVPAAEAVSIPAVDMPLAGEEPVEIALMEAAPFIDEPFEEFVTELVPVGAEPLDEAVPAGAESIEETALPTIDMVGGETAGAEGSALAALSIASAPQPQPETEVTVGDVTLSSALLDIYLNEARQRLATLQEELAQLEEHPDVPIRHDFMRAAHTLCGISRTVGFKSPAELSFELEEWLKQMLEHPQPANSKQLSVMGSAIVSLKEMVQVIQDRKLPKPAKQLMRSLQALVKKARAASDKAAAIRAVALPEPDVAAAEGPVPAKQAADSKAPDTSVAQAEEPAEPVLAERRAEVRALTVPLPTSRDDIDAEIFPLFQEEAHDLIPLIGGYLRDWRNGNADAAASQNLQRALHTLKGSARMAGALQLGDLVHRMEARVIEIMGGGIPSAAFLDELDAYFDHIGDLLDRLEGKSTVVAAPTPTEEGPEPAAVQAEARPAAQQLRVRADTLDRLVNDAGEISITRSRIEGEMQGFKHSLLELTENVMRLRGQVREIEIQAEGRMQSQSNQGGGAAEAFDPLEFDRFTRFQELTRFLAESVNDVATVQHSLLKNLGEADAALQQQARLNRELQQELMHIRMVPLSSIAERLQRIVRQTARELDKKAKLEIRGGQVELDRSVLEKMTAPLEHLLRNSLAHGVESASERLRAGKPETGAIHLEARQEGNEIVLTLSDDGAGFNLASIRSNAVRLGKLPASGAIEPARLISMMFEPGFSTAKEVTQVAGRGIGLDVVRSEIAGLGGRIEAAPGANGGATFTIYLPLTLAVAQAVVVRAGEKIYAIPSAMVEQVQEFKEAALEGIYQKGEIKWLNNHYAMFYLPRLLGEPESTPEANRYSVALLLKSGTQRVAVQVDEILGNREVVVKNIGPQLARIPGIAGATVLGNGRVALIINPVPLAQRTGKQEFSVAAAPKVEAPTAPTAPVIMVVDDSLTVRKITSRLLTKEGYQVVTAKDGVDALEQMQVTPPDVMLVDIEMPRMDGFELTRNVRGDEQTVHIPIIMITSRTADKHRDYAKELGVNAYLGKPYQEDELLGHIAGFVKKP